MTTYLIKVFGKSILIFCNCTLDCSSFWVLSDVSFALKTLQDWQWQQFEDYFVKLELHSQTSSKGISNSKCDVGNWKIHMCDIFKILEIFWGMFWECFGNSLGIDRIFIHKSNWWFCQDFGIRQKEEGRIFNP
mgnify:CR=1 FL=1